MPIDNVLSRIGNTPLLRLQKVVPAGAATVLAKCEQMNPGGSVKDRIALSMVEAAERDGKLKPGGLLVEPTSGNTGVGLALVAAVKGYRLIVTMPETMSVERRRILQRYGATVVLTPGPERMPGAVKRAEALVQENPGAVMLQQFENPANPDIHRRTTGPEIVRDAGGKVDAFVAGIGTGGTITGVGEVLKRANPAVRIIGLEPETSAVLSGRPPGSHKIQGIGAGFVPAVLRRDLLDEVRTVSDSEAFEMAARLAKEEGLLVGISAGANVTAAVRLATELGAGKIVVTVLCDTGERYLSIE
ncbi:MAG: cysteine synthase A [Planctomycetota bacterium]